MFGYGECDTTGRLEDFYDILNSGILSANLLDIWDFFINAEDTDFEVDNVEFTLNGTKSKGKLHIKTIKKEYSKELQMSFPTNTIIEKIILSSSDKEKFNLEIWKKDKNYVIEFNEMSMEILKEETNEEVSLLNELIGKLKQLFKDVDYNIGNTHIKNLKKIIGDQVSFRIG